MMTIDKTIEVCNCGQKPAFDGTNEPHWHRNSCPIYRPPPKKPVVTIESLAAELKELREFVGVITSFHANEFGGKEMGDNVFIIVDGYGNELTTGTDPFDAWRKMNAGEGE